MNVNKININQSSQTYYIASDIYDVSYHNNNITFESLSALLSDEKLPTLIPSAVRCGGMSIRFIQSSDNKYVQYRLMDNTFSTDEDDWQGVDEQPTAGSNNLVTSNGVSEKLAYKKVATLSNFKKFFTKTPYSIHVGESYKFILKLGQQATGEVNLVTTIENDVKQYKNTKDAGVNEITWEVGITKDASHFGVVMANYATLGAQAKCDIYKLVPVNELIQEEVGDNLCLKAKLDNIKLFSTHISYNIQIGKRYKMTLTLKNASVGETNFYTAVGSDVVQETSKYNNAGLTYFEWEFFATKTATSVGVVISDSSLREGAIFSFYEAVSVNEQVNKKIEGTFKEVLVSYKTGFYEPSTMMVNPLKAGQKYRIELSLGGATSNNVAFGTARSFIENAEVKQWSAGGSGTLVWDNFTPAVNVDYFTVYIQDYSTIGTSSVLRIYQYFDNDMKENSYNLNYFNNISQIKNKVVLFLGHSLFGKDHTMQSTVPTGADEVCERMNGYNGNVFLNYAFGGSDWAENSVRPSVLARYKEATENDNAPISATNIDSIIICQGENGTTQLAIGYDKAVELAKSSDPESADPKNGHIVTTLKYIAEHSPQARIYLVKAFACNIPNWTENDHILYRDALKGYCDVLGLIFIDGMLNTGIHKWIEADENTRFYTVDGTHPYTIEGKRRQMSSIMKTVFDDFNNDELWNSFFLSKRR